MEKDYIKINREAWPLGLWIPKSKKFSWDGFVRFIMTMIGHR